MVLLLRNMLQSSAVYWIYEVHLYSAALRLLVLESKIQIIFRTCRWCDSAAHLFNSDLDRHFVKDANLCLWTVRIRRIVRNEDLIIVWVVSILAFEGNETLETESV